MPVFFLLAVSALYSSGKSENKDSAGIDLSDSKGRQVSLYAYPEKVISLGPNITETVFALGKEDLLIGRTDWCNYPEEALDIPSIGTLQEPNLEIIISMQPDLVIGSTHISQETVSSLENLGIPVALLYGEGDFSGLADVISGCGKLLGADEKAREIMDDIEARRQAVQDAVAGRKSIPRVYYALGFGDAGDWTAGAGTFIDNMISMAGGENIATHEGWSYSKEMLVDENPEVVFLALGDGADFLTLPIYKDLAASRAGKVYEIDTNILDRQGPRLIDGLEQLSAIFEGSLEK